MPMPIPAAATTVPTTKPTDACVTSEAAIADTMATQVKAGTAEEETTAKG